MLRRGDGRSRRGQPQFGRQALGLGAVVCLILVAAVVLAEREYRSDRERVQERNATLLRETSSALEAVGEVVETTASAQALVGEDGTVPPAAFESFASAFIRQTVISSVTYARRVDAAERDDFESQSGIDIIESGHGDRPLPAGERAMYYPATLVVSAGLPITGLDMASDPDRREAMERARIERRPVATRPLRLPTRDEPGFLVFTPLFTPGPGADEPVGFIAVGYLADEVESFLASQLPAGTGIRITHHDRTLVQRGDVPADRREALVSVAARRWMVAVAAPGPAPLRDWVAILAVGLVLAAAVGTVGAYLIAQNRRLRIERARTLRLQAATADLATSPTTETVRRNAVDHVAAMLDDTRTVYAHLDDGGAVQILTTTGERRPDLELSPEPIVQAVDDRRVGRTENMLVFPTGGDPGGRDAVVALPSGREPDERDIDLCASLALVVGAAMRRAAAQELEHGMAETLQRQALPASIPDVPGWSIAAAYRPALQEAGVGGDWYDVYRPDENRLVVTVGDIVGHGIGAAGAMGQVRMAVRSLAEVLAPHRILEHLDRMASDIAGAAHASIICMEADLKSNEIVYSSAGLLPPVLQRGRSVDFLWDGRGPIIGVKPGRSRRSASETLGRGDRLIVYTDGLVETRTGELDQGLAELEEAAVATRHLDTARACEEILTRLTGTAEAQDDIALVVATVED